MKQTPALTIAGGGLAGLALGIALRRKEVPVTILEAGTYPRHRVCGEFISGVTDDELRELGIEDLFLDAKSHRSTLWYEGDQRLLEAELPEPARGLSRYALDLRLADRFVAVGGILETGTRHQRDVHSDLEGWVMAAGRPRRPSSWMGLKAHYIGPPLQAGLEIHISDSCYIGLTQVEDSRVNVCGLFRRSSPLKADDKSLLLPAACEQSGLKTLRDRLLASSVDEDSVKGVNQFSLGWQPRPASDELRIGDGAAMIPPFTGNGMSMAFQSALDAVDPLLRWHRGECPWRQTVQEIRSAHRRRFARRLRWAWLFHGMVLSPTARQIGLGAIRRGWLPFERIHRLLR